MLPEKGYGGLKKPNVEENPKKRDHAGTKEFYEAAVIFTGSGAQIHQTVQRCWPLKWRVETDKKRKSELLEISEMCKTYGGRSAQLYEAVETIYLTHLPMIESNGHSFSFGRFDQYIYPYYEKDMKAGVINKDRALEIITHFFIQTNSINKARPWDHTQYSAGYPLYSNLILGGLKPDGTDGTNDLSYLCLEAMNLEPPAGAEPQRVRYHDGTPRSLIVDAKLIRTGFGQPSMFEDDVVIPCDANAGYRP